MNGRKILQFPHCVLRTNQISLRQSRDFLILLEIVITRDDNPAEAREESLIYKDPWHLNYQRTIRTCIHFQITHCLNNLESFSRVWILVIPSLLDFAFL